MGLVRSLRELESSVGPVPALGLPASLLTMAGREGMVTGPEGAQPEALTSFPSTGVDPSAMSESDKTYKNPLLWVSTSYLAMGLIYVSVSGVANIMFKNLGMSNAKAAFWSSLFVFPYVIKPLWAPVLEIYKTKKFFVLLDAVPARRGRFSPRRSRCGFPVRPG